MRLDYQILLKLPPLILLAGSVLVPCRVMTAQHDRQITRILYFTWFPLGRMLDSR